MSILSDALHHDDANLAMRDTEYVRSGLLQRAIQSDAPIICAEMSEYSPWAS